MVRYYHSDCGGKIGILRRKCSKCGKRWPLKVWIQYPIPEDIYMASSKGPTLRRKKVRTPYASWANKYPQVGDFASRLPNWPRWARILTFVGILCVLGFISYLLWGCIQWIRH